MSAFDMFIAFKFYHPPSVILSNFAISFQSGGKQIFILTLNNLFKSTSHTSGTINVTDNIWCKSFHIFTWSDQYHSLAALYTTHIILHTAGSTLAWLLGYLLVSFLGFGDEGNLLFSPR